MHPELLFSVIKSQAGTLSKAVLELVMNSIDAGATKVEVSLDRKALKVSDDGKGFASRREIDEFFETFGTPHKEGDSIYGRFRMGRGQCFAFAVNQWRSGEFQMDVDIQGRGLDYTLQTGLAAVKGCHVDGRLYEPLDPSELINTERTLKEQCRYTPAPVYLNGKLLTEKADGQKWTLVDEDAYIRANDSRQLSVYNLGVLVAHFSSAEFGVGGVVVSKKQLEVNFARNDILRNKCAVWRRIRPILSKMSGDMDGKEPTQKRTEEWRAFQAKSLIAMTEANYHQAREAESLPLFTDIAGKHLSLSQISRNAHDRAIVVAPAKTLLADKLHQAKMACVLTPETFSERFGMDFDELLDRLAKIESNDGRRVQKPFEYTVMAIRRALADFDEVAKAIQSDHHVMDAKHIPKDAAAAVKAIGEAQWHLIRALNGDHRLGQAKPRKIRVMESETADAYTDGREYVFVNVKMLRGADGPNNGASWAARMAALLIHEYCHDFDSGVGHLHDTGFFEAYHEATSAKAFGDLVGRLMMAWAQTSKSDLGKVSVRLLHQIDKQARMDDRMELAA